MRNRGFLLSEFVFSRVLQYHLRILRVLENPSHCLIDTLLRTHNKLEWLYLLHGFAEKQSPLSSSKLQNPEFRFGPRKSHQKWSRDGCVKVNSSALLELVPETRKENLEFDLLMYGCCGPSCCRRRGPVGFAVAQQVSEADLSVCSIDPEAMNLEQLCSFMNSQRSTSG
ncbi:hypothetical protein HHK36_019601 [Tetracentron sinense]|uniref:Uncharacterized protein n=1 Tax=Tetracentron sinense TaxID=13715 RepID=A0A834YZF9_TETSI|nr:hypothetical protein HHK36_019601 [Tetracentron sinense]